MSIAVEDSSIASARLVGGFAAKCRPTLGLIGCGLPMGRRWTCSTRSLPPISRHARASAPRSGALPGVQPMKRPPGMRAPAKIIPSKPGSGSSASRRRALPSTSTRSTAWWTTLGSPGLSSTARTNRGGPSGTRSTKLRYTSSPSAGTVYSPSSSTTRSGSPSCHPAVNVGGVGGVPSPCGAPASTQRCSVARWSSVSLRSSAKLPKPAAGSHGGMNPDATTSATCVA